MKAEVMQKLHNTAQFAFCCSVNSNKHKKLMQSYARQSFPFYRCYFVHKNTDFSYTFEVKLVSSSTTQTSFPMDLCVELTDSTDSICDDKQSMNSHFNLFLSEVVIEFPSLLLLSENLIHLGVSCHPPKMVENQ